MYIKQISVFLENTKGTLSQMTKLLGENGVNLLAMTVADNAGFGIVRIIVKSEDVYKAVGALRNAGDMARVSDVICVRIPHKPMGLAEVLNVLEEKDISIEYSYSFCRTNIDDAVIILRPSDKAAGVEALTAAGVVLISQEEVDEF